VQTEPQLLGHWAGGKKMPLIMVRLVATAAVEQKAAGGKGGRGGGAGTCRPLTSVLVVHVLSWFALAVA